MSFPQVLGENFQFYKSILHPHHTPIATTFPKELTMNRNDNLSRRDASEVAKSLLLVLAIAIATGYASVHALIA